MKKWIILYIVVALVQWSFGQLPAKNKKRRPEKLIVGGHKITDNTCYMLGAETPEARQRHYPFNISKEIQLVSFLGSVLIKNDDTAYVADGLPMMHDTICLSKLRERKSLSTSQIDSLTDIIFNYQAKRGYHLLSVAACYMPRNAILFLDDSGKVVEYIEICFECGRTRGSSEKVSLGFMCDQKLKLIYGVFKRAGIKHGITEGRVTDNL